MLASVVATLYQHLTCAVASQAGRRTQLQLVHPHHVDDQALAHVQCGTPLTHTYVVSLTQLVNGHPVMVGVPA